MAATYALQEVVWVVVLGLGDRCGRPALFEVVVTLTALDVAFLCSLVVRTAMVTLVHREDGIFHGHAHDRSDLNRVPRALLQLRSSGCVTSVSLARLTIIPSFTVISSALLTVVTLIIGTTLFVFEACRAEVRKRHLVAVTLLVGAN